MFWWWWLFGGGEAAPAAASLAPDYVVEIPADDIVVRIPA